MATTTVNLGINLDGLSNVDTTGKANGNILVWNSTSNKWEDAAPSGGGTPAGATGEVQFNNAGVFAADSNFVWDNTHKRLGVGATPASTVRLDVMAQGALSTDIAFRVRNSADTRDFLKVNGIGNVFNNGSSGLSTNTFYGENAGNSATGGFNTFIGNIAGQYNTSGIENTFVGYRAGALTTVEKQNTFIGAQSGFNNSTGQQNAFLGSNSGVNNTTGSHNTFIGRQAGVNNASGGSNVCIGSNTNLSANNGTNQIVIGTSTNGTGNNSVTLGNTSIVQTNLRGQIVILGFATAPAGIAGGIYYDTTTNKHYGFDGTNWNQLY